MTRIAVLGGSGFLGSRVVAALKRAKADVSVASRRSEVKVDVTKPETWGALEAFDVVVDLSDTVSTPPDRLIAWLLERGKCVIEATSDAPCVERLAAANEGTKGQLVLGGGIFTGVSNLLARDVARRAGAVEQVQLGISSSPFSGAGTGTIALMVNAMGVPPVRYENGERIEEQGLLRGPVLDFAGTRRPSGVMSLAEPSMLARSTGAKKIDVYFAPRPGFLVSAFTVAPLWLARRGWYQALMRGYFTVLRKFLLRSKESAVELTATARGTSVASRWVSTPDGMEAGGVALAAMAEAVAKQTGWSGVKCIDELTELERIVARANELAGKTLLTLSPAASGSTEDASTRAA